MKSKLMLIKICGVTSPDVAFAAGENGADYVGMIFHPDSRRHVERATAVDIVRAIISSGATPVAVCVDQSAAEITQLCAHLDINTVQLHGVHSRQQSNLLPNTLSRIYVCPVDAAGRVTNQCEPNIKALRRQHDYLLFDGLVGGSGQRIITRQLSATAGNLDYFIAGGLSPDNVAEVIDDCQPSGVDVSSGVENEVGHKNIAAIKQFISNTHNRSVS